MARAALLESSLFRERRNPFNYKSQIALRRSCQRTYGPSECQQDIEPVVDVRCSSDRIGTLPHTSSV
ncbi:hypothetical protein BAUCODRAFT_38502 [Baudoinia panamericana UAMH 10762]|uniref:Uncharacterized protein n=1 Tax=Baudoinia panamericana (strain UAMH 10762) TaxID=717646 RepID=M2N0H4_BAUPA|nr:uncharacterized protein BAUCODRAFT_38502 [Baudoinia panamericana UAMH 10762]EMC92439.1 hypothetical protein BAUCODRAFT_38502 [Baudoinia panamericana UAMH 10762]